MKVARRKTKKWMGDAPESQSPSKLVIIKGEVKKVAEEMDNKTQEAIQVIAEAIKTEVEEVQERRPGLKIKGYKVPWTYGDVEKAFEKVTFIPDETIVITWNQLSWQLKDNEEITVPSIVKQEWDKHKREVRAAGRGALTSYGWTPVIGVGPLTGED